MEYTVERIINDLNHTCLGWSYKNFDDVLEGLLYNMRDKIGHPFIGEQYRNLRFVMNVPLHNEFYTVCQMSCRDSDMYRGVKIIPDLSLRVSDNQSPVGIVRLICEEEPGVKRDPYYNLYCADDVKVCYEIFASNHDTWKMLTKPHIDHVKFNGHATIVFWKDGTKTVVKHDGKGRKDKRLAILYAFIRKIYGEGKPYHNILNEIEEVIK